MCIHRGPYTSRIHAAVGRTEEDILESRGSGSGCVHRRPKPILIRDAVEDPATGIEASDDCIAACATGTSPLPNRDALARDGIGDRGIAAGAATAAIGGRARAAGRVRGGGGSGGGGYDVAGGSGSGRRTGGELVASGLSRGRGGRLLLLLIILLILLIVLLLVVHPYIVRSGGSGGRGIRAAGPLKEAGAGSGSGILLVLLILDLHGAAGARAGTSGSGAAGLARAARAGRVAAAGLRIGVGPQAGSGSVLLLLLIIDLKWLIGTGSRAGSRGSGAAALAADIAWRRAVCASIEVVPAGSGSLCSSRGGGPVHSWVVPVEQRKEHVLVVVSPLRTSTAKLVGCTEVIICQLHLGLRGEAAGSGRVPEDDSLMAVAHRAAVGRLQHVLGGSGRVEAECRKWVEGGGVHRRTARGLVPVAAHGGSRRGDLLGQALLVLAKVRMEAGAGSGTVPDVNAVVAVEAVEGGRSGRVSGQQVDLRGGD